jgi:ABC-2 type transport system permease protein
MNIFTLEVRNIRKSVLKWTIAVASITFMMLAFFPAMQTESMQALAGAKMEGIDPALLQALGLTEMMDFTIITNFFGYVLQFITLAIMVYVTQQAVNSLIKEETDGTIEFLYSKPVSRSEIFCQKLLVNVVSFLFMIVVFGIVTVIGYISFSDYNLIESIKEVSILYGAILYVGLIFMSIGMLLSAIIRSSKGSSGITIAIVFGTFVLGLIGALIEDLSFLFYFSPMDWIKTQKLMNDGIIMEEWIIGISVIIICNIAAHEIYRRKDLRV